VSNLRREKLIIFDGEALAGIEEGSLTGM
jgi:hypothetical protein